MAGDSGGLAGEPPPPRPSPPAAAAQPRGKTQQQGTAAASRWQRAQVRWNWEREKRSKRNDGRFRLLQRRSPCPLSETKKKLNTGPAPPRAGLCAASGGSSSSSSSSRARSRSCCSCQQDATSGVPGLPRRARLERRQRRSARRSARRNNRSRVVLPFPSFFVLGPRLLPDGLGGPRGPPEKGLGGPGVARGAEASFGTDSSPSSSAEATAATAAAAATAATPAPLAHRQRPAGLRQVHDGPRPRPRSRLRRPRVGRPPADAVGGALACELE